MLVSLVLIGMYGANLFFSLHTTSISIWKRPANLSRAGVPCVPSYALGRNACVAWVSDILVKSVEPLAANLGWSQLFIGVIVVAIVGNAAENASAVLIARKNRMDVALQISIGSATQIVLLVAPVLVLLGALFGQPMNLVFTTLELVATVLAVVIVGFIVQDGERIGSKACSCWPPTSSWRLRSFCFPSRFRYSRRL